MTQIKTEVFSDSLFNQIYTLLARNDFTNTTVCQPNIVTNCLEPLDFDTCKTCITGFYKLDNGTCQINPTSQIENCSVYTSPTNCVTCN